MIKLLKTPRYSELREVGEKMRKKQVKNIDIDTYRAIMCDFYTYKAKEELDVICCDGSCC